MTDKATPTLFVYDTERLEDELDDVETATGCTVVRLGQEWSKEQGVDHCSPASLAKAIALAEKTPRAILLVDSATDVCEYPRDQYAAKNKGKKIAYAVVDAQMSPVVRALKDAKAHWILTMRESDERGTVNGEEVVIDKKGKASKDLQYVARVKGHCVKMPRRSNKSCSVEIRDQRGLRDQPPQLLTDPKVADLAPLVERYRPDAGRYLRAHFFGREGSGKTGTALRLVIALMQRLKEGQ